MWIVRVRAGRVERGPARAPRMVDRRVGAAAEGRPCRRLGDHDLAPPLGDAQSRRRPTCVVVASAAIATLSRHRPAVVAAGAEERELRVGARGTRDRVAAVGVGRRGEASRAVGCPPKPTARRRRQAAVASRYHAGDRARRARRRRRRARSPRAGACRCRRCARRRSPCRARRRPSRARRYVPPVGASACRIALRTSRNDGSGGESRIAVGDDRSALRRAADRALRRSHSVSAQISPSAWTSGARRSCRSRRRCSRRVPARGAAGAARCRRRRPGSRAPACGCVSRAESM